MPTLEQSEYRRLKTRLTRKQNIFTALQIEYRDHPNDTAVTIAFRAAACSLRDEAAQALSYFAIHGYPDAWHRWERAVEDADYALLWLSR